MTVSAGAPDVPRKRGLTGCATMADNSDKERGAKRGVLSTGRARKMQDADADDRANDDDSED